jgi:hypothetical protein
MKLVTLFLLFTLSCTPVSIQATTGRKVSPRVADRTDSKARLQLTTSITKEVSCHPQHLSLTLRLTFRNIGNEPIILDKKSSVIGRHLVSRSLTAAAANKYEEDTRYESFNADEIGFRFDPPADMSNFIVLGPGETHTIEDPRTRVSFDVYEGTSDDKDSLRFGTHFLQIIVPTLFYPPSVAADLRARWRDKGFLWSEPLTSLPMRFEIEKDRQIIKCL